jgi:hypothetical protein
MESFFSGINRAPLNKIQKKWQNYLLFFQTSMKKHLVSVQDIFYKNALMLSRKGN